MLRVRSGSCLYVRHGYVRRRLALILLTSKTLFKVTGYRSGCGYLSLCNGELWQDTDRQLQNIHHTTEEYLSHAYSVNRRLTTQTKGLPHTSRATDAVEIRESSQISHSTNAKTQRSSGLSLGYSRSQRSRFCYRSLTFSKNDTNVSKKLTPRATLQL